MIRATENSVGRGLVGVRLSAIAIAALGLAVMVPAVYAASASPVKGATYSGSVGPGYPLSFRVSANGRSVDSLAAGSEPECVPGPVSAPVYHFPTMAIKGDSFSGDTSKTGPTQSMTLEITGHFAGKTVSGKVVEKLKIKSLPSCTNTLTFTATAK
jgi:hypothetical protein